ncbi:MAG: O-antigen ligase family protein [Deltaproteobacteria bacterium]|nr:O-antigen ligase family protein [Deltaproteobacteria bacterium]
MRQITNNRGRSSMVSPMARPGILAIVFVPVVLGLSLVLLSHGYVLSAVAGTGLMALTILRPQYGYLLFVVLLGMPLTLMGQRASAGLRLRPPDVVFAGVLVGFFVHRAATRSSSYESTPFIGLGLILHAFMFLSMFWVSDYTWTMASAVRRFYCLAIFLLTIFVIDSEKMLKKVYVAWIVLGTLTAAVALHEFIFFKVEFIQIGTDPVKWGAIRPEGFLNTSHVLAAILAFSIFLIFGQLQVLKNVKLRFLLFCSACLIFVALLATYSKSILYGFAAGCIVFAYRSVEFKRRVLKIVIIAGIGSIPIAGGVFVETLWRRHSEILSYGVEGTIPMRLRLWKASWASILDHPFLGVGLGGFRSTIPAYDPKSTTSPHNLYMFFLTEYGIIGLLILLGAILYMVKETIYVMKNTRDDHLKIFSTATFCGMVTYGVAAMALSYSLAEYIFWAFFGLHCVTVRYASKYCRTKSGSRR